MGLEGAAADRLNLGHVEVNFYGGREGQVDRDGVDDLQDGKWADKPVGEFMGLRL